MRRRRGDAIASTSRCASDMSAIKSWANPRRCWRWTSSSKTFALPGCTPSSCAMARRSRRWRRRWPVISPSGAAQARESRCSSKRPVPVSDRQASACAVVQQALGSLFHRSGDLDRAEAAVRTASGCTGRSGVAARRSRACICSARSSTRVESSARRSATSSTRCAWRAPPSDTAGSAKALNGLAACARASGDYARRSSYSGRRSSCMSRLATSMSRRCCSTISA